MNVIAGILIGIINDSWWGRIISPFLWGFVWYSRMMIFKSDYHVRYLEENKERKLKWGMKPKVTFFFIEYITAVSTSLVFSVIAGIVYDLIKK